MATTKLYLCWGDSGAMGKEFAEGPEAIQEAAERLQLLGERDEGPVGSTLLLAGLLLKHGLQKRHKMGTYCVTVPLPISIRDVRLMDQTVAAERFRGSFRLTSRLLGILKERWDQHVEPIAERVHRKQGTPRDVAFFTAE